MAGLLLASRARQAVRSGATKTFSSLAAVKARNSGSGRALRDMAQVFAELQRYSPSGSEPLTPAAPRTWAGVSPECSLSVVVPVYNAAGCIDALLDSLFAQKTEHVFDVICVDDGSTDDSLALLRARAQAEPSLRVIAQQNRGIGGARNTGIEHARGEYLLFVDNDDVLHPNFVQKSMDAATRTSAEVVVTGYTEIDSRTLTVVREGRTARFVVPERLGSLLCDFEGYVWGALIKRSIFERIQFPTGYWYEDMLARMLLFRMAEGFTSIGDPLYVKYDHADNAAKVVWSAKSERCLDQVNLLGHIVRKAAELGLSWEAGSRRALVYELGPMLFARTRGLNDGLRRNAFVAGCHLVHQALPEGCEEELTLSQTGRHLVQSLRRGDYLLWQLAGWSMTLGESLWNSEPQLRGAL